MISSPICEMTCNNIYIASFQTNVMLLCKTDYVRIMLWHLISFLILKIVLVLKIHIQIWLYLNTYIKYREKSLKIPNM